MRKKYESNLNLWLTPCVSDRARGLPDSAALGLQTERPASLALVSLLISFPRLARARYCPTESFAELVAFRLQLMVLFI